MKSVSITPGKNNVGAYINDVNLNKLNNDLTGQIKDILDKYLQNTLIRHHLW